MLELISTTFVDNPFILKSSSQPVSLLRDDHVGPQPGASLWEAFSPSLSSKFVRLKLSGVTTRQLNEVMVVIQPGSSPWWFLTGLLNDCPRKGGLAIWKELYFLGWVLEDRCRLSFSPTLYFTNGSLNKLSFNDRVISLQVLEFVKDIQFINSNQGSLHYGYESWQITCRKKKLDMRPHVEFAVRAQIVPAFPLQPIILRVKMGPKKTISHRGLAKGSLVIFPNSDLDVHLHASKNKDQISRGLHQLCIRDGTPDFYWCKSGDLHFWQSTTLPGLLGQPLWETSTVFCWISYMRTFEKS